MFIARYFPGLPAALGQPVGEMLPEATKTLMERGMAMLKSERDERIEYLKVLIEALSRAPRLF